MNANNAIKLALKAGELMLANGAETYRVEDTMRRLLVSSGYKNGEVFVAASGIFASCEHPDFGLVTGLKRVSTRQTEFEKIIRVNEISRRYTNHEIDFNEALKQLNLVNTIPAFPKVVKILASSIAAACFCFMLGGGYADCVNALLTGIVLKLFMTFLERTKIAAILLNIMGGIVISASSLLLLSAGVGSNLDKIIIGSLMPMLPGITITNAIRDIVDGDMISGTSKMTEALLIAISIAVGVGSFISVWHRLFPLILV